MKDVILNLEEDFANNEYFESVSQPMGSIWNKFFKIKFKIP